MSNYRIVFNYKGKELNRIIDATCKTDANTKFLSKIKESAIKDLKLIKTTLIESETKTFDFDNETVATYLQWALEQIDPDEYDFDCSMQDKRTDEESKNKLQALKDFIKSNYLTNIKIVATGDKK